MKLKSRTPSPLPPSFRSSSLFIYIHFNGGQIKKIENRGKEKMVEYWLKVSSNNFLAFFSFFFDAVVEKGYKRRGGGRESHSAKEYYKIFNGRVQRN